MDKSNFSPTKNAVHKWHGVDFHHPIHSLQDAHPFVYVGLLLGLFALYVVTFAAIASIVGYAIT